MTFLLLAFLPLLPGPPAITAQLSPSAEAQMGVSVIAKPIGGGEIHEKSFDADGQAKFFLDSGRVYALSCSGRGLWCPPIRVTPSRENTQVELKAFPSANFRLQIGAPPGSPRPNELLLQGSIPLTQDHKTIEYELRLKGKNGIFRFQGPRLKHDLRLSLSPYAPIYLWDAGGVTADTFDLGLRLLRLGASLCGTITHEGIGVAGSTVRLLEDPSAAGAVSAEDFRRRSKLEKKTQSLRSGFFQLTGIQAGRYWVEARDSQGRFVATEAFSLANDSETCFQEPLELHNIFRAQVAVTPPTDPDGEPWTLKWSSHTAGPISVVTDKEGKAKIRQLSSGRHFLSILDKFGSMLGSMDVDFLFDDQRLEISLPLVLFDAQVLMGKESFAAEVQLRSGQGDESRYATDQEGRFSGWMRRPKVTWITAHISPLAPPYFNRTLVLRDLDFDKVPVELSLHLTGSSLQGRVLDVEGAAVPGAFVGTQSEAGEYINTETDYLGRYTLQALSPGAYEVVAHLRTHSAEPLRLEVTEGEVIPDHTFLLTESGSFQGSVVLHDGTPALGAALTFETLGHQRSRQEVRTSVEGKFQVMLPEGTDRAVVTVGAGSPVLWSACLLLLPGEEIQLRLPPSPGGAITLRQPRTQGEDGPGRTSPVLFNSDGGYITLQGLFSWTYGALGVDPLSPDSPDFVEYRFLGLAPGRYALAEMPFLVSSVAREIACSGGPPGALWQTLEAGGNLLFQPESSSPGAGP